MEQEKIPVEVHFIKSEPADTEMYLPEDFPDGENQLEADPLQTQSTSKLGTKTLLKPSPIKPSEVELQYSLIVGRKVPTAYAMMESEINEQHSNFQISNMSTNAPLVLNIFNEAIIEKGKSNTCTAIQGPFSQFNTSVAENQVAPVDTEEQPQFSNEENQKVPNEKEDHVHYSSKINYIAGILNESYEGRFLLNAYKNDEKKKNFEDKDDENVQVQTSKKERYFNIHSVARIVVYHELERTDDSTISGRRFKFLAESAEELFPRFSKDIFYTPCKSQASGAFYSFYRTFRRNAVATNWIRPQKNLKRKSNEIGNDYSEAFKKMRLSVEIIDSDYLKKWGEIALNEKTEFYKNSDIDEIFRMFPNLAKPTGYILIQEDFTTLFNKSSDLFMNNWPRIAAKIIKVAQTKKSDNEIKQILDENNSIIKKGQISTVALVLLPYLFNKIMKQTKNSKSGKAWNPEKFEVLKTFIFHKKVSSNVRESLEQVQDDLLKLHTERKLYLGPYVAIFGPTLENITTSYVILGSHSYQVPSVTLAVDILFQSVKVFQKDFSHVSNHVWQFLEKVNLRARLDGRILTYICTACNLEFASVPLYLNHACFVPDDNQDSYTGFHCMYCNMNLPSRTSLLDHVEKSHFASQSCCKICFKEFDSRKSLRNHILQNHKPAKCIGQKILSLALQGVSPDQNLECPKCDYINNDLDDFVDHVLIHRPHICSFCNCDKFTTKNELLGHLKLHIEKYNHVCSKCKCRCPSEKILERHRRYPITWCTIKHTTADIYMKHVIGHLETDKNNCHCLKCVHESREKIQCFVCHAWWTTEANAKEHMKQCISDVRNNLPKKVCKYCYWIEAFVQNEIDKIKETEENSCFYCDIPFKKPRFLYLHYLKYHPAHKERCWTCNKYFRLTADLKTHKFLHTQRKKHASCLKCFKSLHNLWNQKELENMLQFKADDPKSQTLICIGCNSAFNDVNSLKHHTQNECYHLQESEEEEMSFGQLIADIGDTSNLVEVKEENICKEYVETN